jgi:UDP-glucose 4-epimerase
VLGGTGFVGSHLTAALRRSGAEVAVVEAPPSAAARHFEDDLTSALRRHRPTAVVHLIGSGTPTLRRRGYHEARNVQAARAVASAMRSTDYTGTLLFASTGGVYGNVGHAVDEQAPLLPVTDYARAKLEAERILTDATASVVIARLFQVYGEGQRKLVVYELARRVQGERGPLRLQSSGAEVRDLAHVDEVVGALRSLLAADLDLGCRSPVINVASGVGTRIDDLARRLLRLAGQDHREVLPGKASDQNPLKVSVGDASKLRGLGVTVSPVSDSLLLGVLEWVAANAS